MAEISFQVDNTSLETVSSLTIGANFDEMKEALTELMEPYKGMTISEADVPQAKKDRARINKVISSIDERRKMVKSLYTRPLALFEAKCKELTDICKDGARNLDEQVKTYETAAKKRKLNTAESFFESEAERAGVKEFITFESILNPKWGNVTYSIENIEKEIIGAVHAVHGDVSAIKALNSPYEQYLFSIYRSSHNVGDVIRTNAQILEADAKKKQQEEEARRKAEAEKQAQEKQAREKPVCDLPKDHLKTCKGYDPYEKQTYPCPNCGSDDYEYIYKDAFGAIVGCDICIHSMERFDYIQQLKEIAEGEYENRVFEESRQ